MTRLLFGALLLMAASVARAQVTETPIPFDSGGRVQSITPALAARLSLAAPVWPVEGVYSSVRLYEQSTGRFVLAALLENGVLVRYEISAEQRLELMARVTEAMARVGRPATEENADVISERASGAFMRDQLALAFTLYGGTLATLVDDETLSPALYLMAPAATFFIAGGYVKRHPISRAQNDLASDLALRTALMGIGTLYAFGVKDSPKAYAATLFAGGLGGTVAGLNIGRGMTDGESHGLTSGSTAAAVTTFGLLGASGLLSDNTETNERAVVGGVVAGALVGMPLGLRYVRKARHVVTAGDLTAMSLSGILGVAVSTIPLVDSDDSDPQMAFGLATIGYVGGLMAGERLLVRPYDHTQGEAGLLAVGAAAGALMAGGVGIIASVDNATVVATLLTGGAIAGVVLTENLIEPRRAGASAPRRAERGDSRRVRVSISPAGAAQAAARIPGRSSLLTITF
jgi:hypothetical protein